MESKNRAALMKYFFVILFFFSLPSFAHEGDQPAVKKIPHKDQSIEFTKNKGQWKSNIQFQASIPSGRLYFESNKLTYVFYSQEDIARQHALRHGPKDKITESDQIVHGHLFQISFPGADVNTTFQGRKVKSNYVNYFLGNNRKYWASKVPVYRETYASDLWKGIDFRMYRTILI